MTAFLSPVAGAGAQFFTNTGVVLAGGKLATYLAGSTTPQATYTTSSQSVQNANPIILDSAGRPPNEVWLSNGVGYKFVLLDASNNTLGTWDNITGINVSTLSQSEWIVTGFVPTYLSVFQFTVSGNQTASFNSNRRLQYGLATGTYYGSVSSSSFDGINTTTVNVLVDSTPLDSTLYFVNYSLLSASNVSVPQQFVKQGDAINNSPIGNVTPSTGAFTNLSASNVNFTGGTITGITGFSTPDFLIIAQGVI